MCNSGGSTLPDEENLGREVVGVSVEEYSARIGAQWIILPGALSVAQELEVVYLCFPVMEVALAGVVLEQCAADDYLVEEVPLTSVSQGADSLVEDRPEGVVEAVRLHSVRFFGGTKHLGARLVVGVVVEVRFTLTGTMRRKILSPMRWRRNI